MKFIGRKIPEEIHALYSVSDCLIFPSKLETWGLPITEFKEYCKPMLLINTEYAKETVGEYNKVCYFNNNPFELALLMESVINNNSQFNKRNKHKIQEPYSETWVELFDMIIEK